MGSTANCVFFVLFGLVGTKEMIWKYDSDIANKANWVGGELAEGCTGVHFAPVNPAPVVIHELTTGEVTLPKDGEVRIADGGFIELKDDRKCIKLKPNDYHEWYDPDSWRQAETNVAIPDKERVPCIYDDVVFPKAEHVCISSSLGYFFLVRSVRIEDEVSPERELSWFTDYGFLIKNERLFRLHAIKSSCTDPHGCLCHRIGELVPCPSNIKQEKLSCTDPITPEGFCRDICGAYLTFEPGKLPNLDKLKRKLKQYSSDTHISRVEEYWSSKRIQVVFSEKEYTGKSLEEAESFLEYVKKFQVKDPELFKSGEFYFQGGTSPLPIIFGSLAAVLIFFAVLFYLNSDPATIAVFTTRFNRARGSVFNVPFFARFDNTDENLIIDGQSESGSILDISKSFDNPMYGQAAATSQSTATSEHENPLYEVAKDVDVEE